MHRLPRARTVAGVPAADLDLQLDLFADASPSWGDCVYDVDADTTVFLTGVSTDLTRAAGPAHRHLGLLVTPASGLQAQIGRYRLWAADNGCFAETPARPFRPAAFLRWLAALPREGCLFAVAPDVVGDAAATLARSQPMLPRIRDLGFPVAVVAQDGLEHIDRAGDLDWTGFDALFIGGSTEWKLSQAAADLARRARDRGLWTHMGRVNSYRRLRAAASTGFDSVDGTYLAYGPQVNGPRLMDWLDRLPQERFPADQQHRFRWVAAGPAASGSAARVAS